MFLTATPVPVRMSQKAKTSAEYTFTIHYQLLVFTF